MRSHRVTLLIVAGDNTLGQFYTEYFAHTKIAVVQIPTWKGAIDYLETQQTPTVVLLEMRLPNGSGQAHCWLLANLPEICADPCARFSPIETQRGRWNVGLMLVLRFPQRKRILLGFVQSNDDLLIADNQPKC